MAPKKTNGRPGVSCASADDIFMHWQKLNTEQRSASLHFTDTELVARILEALQHMQRQHDACLAAGFKLTSEGCADPFKNSPLLGDILCFSVTRRTAMDGPRRTKTTETDFGLQIKDDFLERGDLFDILRSVLPDLLEPRSKSRRSPLPRQHWKRLWDTMPTSFHVLEQQMAMTMEQALWAMAAAASQTIQEESASVKSNVSLDDIAEESWMIESVPKAMTATAKNKKRGTKCKKHRGKEVHAVPRQELQDVCHEITTVSELDLAMHNEQRPPCGEAICTEIKGQSCVEAGEGYALCKANSANIENNNLACCEIPAAESSDDQASITKERHCSDASAICEVHTDTARRLAEDSEGSCAAGERQLQEADEVLADLGLSEHCEISASENSDDQALITRQRNCSDASTICGLSAQDSEETGEAGERQLLEADEVSADLGLSERCEISASESSDDQALITRERNCSDASVMCNVHSETAGSLAGDSEESGEAVERHLQEASEVLADRGLSEMEPLPAIMPEQAENTDYLADDSVNALGHDLFSNEQITCSPGEPCFISCGAPVTNSLSADQLSGLAGPPGLGAPPGPLAPWLLVPPHPGPDPSWPRHLSLLHHAGMQASSRLLAHAGLAPLGLPLPSEPLAPPGLLQPWPSCLQQLPGTQQSGPPEAPRPPGPAQRFCGWCGHEHRSVSMRFCAGCGCRVPS
jgi:hypothetical protein